MEDITERKRVEEALLESEERYRSLFDGVPVGLYRSTPAGQILDANPALVQMLGYPDRQTLLAVNTTDTYVDPEDRARWQILMERDGVVPDFEFQARQYDGTVIWLRNTARAVRDSDGRLLYYEGSLDDITARKRTEEALRQHSERLAILHEAERTAVAVMEERERLVRELHDSVVQSLYSLTLFAEAGRELAKVGDLEHVSQYLGEIVEGAHQALKEMRLLVHELRPPVLEEEGLVEALRRRLDAVEGRAGVSARTISSPKPP